MAVEDDAHKFAKAKSCFVRGDPRPLAEWVLAHDLNDEQREFVASALLGDVEKIDGRKVKSLTDRIHADYGRIRFLNCMLEIFDPTDPKKMNDAKVARMLANKYGYQDVDSVRRALNRHKK